MKRFFSKLVLAIVVISLCGCNHESGYNGGGDDTINIPVTPQSGDYIFFDIDKISRGELLEGTLNKDFNVIGYRYATDSWEYAKAQASQNREFSFLGNNDLPASGQMGVFNHRPLTVQYNSGVHEYNDQGSIHDDGNLRQWEKNLRYAFFGWYPTTLTLNGGNQNLEGEPYISYSLPGGTDVDADARKAMVDVLTASEIDTYKAKSMSVVFEMQHRLAALDIQASHMITTKALKDTYDDWDGVDDEKPVTVTVNSVSLTLANIYKSVDIYLNPDAVIKRGNKEYVGQYPSGSYTPTFVFDNVDVSFDYNVQKSLVKSEEKMILIPQNDVIATISTITYTVTCGGISREFTSTHNITEDRDYSVLLPLVEGHHAYLLLTVTKSGLFVQVEQAPTWEEKKVEYEFD